jgi:DNA-binding CsgD family transcriptional regulator
MGTLLSTASHPAPSPINNLLVVPLSPAEIRVIDTLAEHLCTNQEVADRLGLKLNTVKHHLTAVMDKTGTFTRLELVVKWRTKEFQDWLRDRGIR